MRNETIAQIEQELLKKRQTVLSAVRTELEVKDNLSAPSEDLLDQAAATEQLEITSQLATTGSARLTEIEEALTRIKDGTYGICTDCEKPIAIARLEALPTASRCIQCQSLDDNQSSRSRHQSNGHTKDSDSNDSD